MPPWGSNTQRYQGKTQEETRNTGVTSDDEVEIIDLLKSSRINIENFIIL